MVSGFALATIDPRAVMTAGLVASASHSTVVLRLVNPRPRSAAAMSSASFTQPLNQLLAGRVLNSLIPTHRALRVMAVSSLFVVVT